MTDSPSIGGNSATLSEAPASFEQAFASDASPAPDPSTQDTTTPAAVQPGSEQVESPQQQEERSPFIPRARFDEVVTARKQMEEQLKGWEGYDWAKAEGVREIVQMIADSKGDPMAFFARQFADLAQHPEHGQRLRSFLGQQLGQFRQRQTQEPPALQMPEPDVMITDAQGNTVGKTYSAEAQAQRDAFIKQQLMQEIAQQYGPKLQTLDALTAEREQAARSEQANQFASSFMQELGSLPGFTPEVGKLIAKDLADLRVPPDADPAVINAAAYRAYVKHAVPTLGAKAQSQMLDTLQQKAAASTSVNPGSAAPASAKSYKSFHDLPAEAWR